MPADIPPITDSYLSQLEAIDAIHRIDLRTTAVLEQLAELAGLVAELAEDWAEFKPVAQAFTRGGILAARTAAKVARRDSNGQARGA